MATLPRVGHFTARWPFYSALAIGPRQRRNLLTCGPGPSRKSITTPWTRGPKRSLVPLIRGKERRKGAGVVREGRRCVGRGERRPVPLIEWLN